MPQMSLGGLSEAWLFREIGDIHWTMLSSGLESPSSELADANGDRLYATFTRLKLTSTASLLAFAENESITARGKIARFGGGVFFSDVAIGNDSRLIEAQIMTSFTKRSSSAANGVSELHGHVADGMWKPLLKSAGLDSISSVTNGIHPSTWIGRDLRGEPDRKDRRHHRGGESAVPDVVKAPGIGRAHWLSRSAGARILPRLPPGCI